MAFTIFDTYIELLEMRYLLNKIKKKLSFMIYDIIMAHTMYKISL